MRKSIKTKLQEISGRRALVPYLTCSFPDMSSFERLALSVCRAGADILEIGLPFSDPLADGPSIQYSSGRALNNGFTVEKGFASISRIARKTDIPLVVMTYLNIVRAAGETKFLQKCCRAGVAGVVVPDLPIDLAIGFKQLCRRFSIDLILLASPTTPPERIRRIAETSTGFLYLVSLRGTTGQRKRFPSGTLSIIREAKRLSPIPVLVGFGISGPVMAAQAARYSDGVIVGSALIEIIRSSRDIEKASEKLTIFLKSIKKEINP